MDELGRIIDEKGNVIQTKVISYIIEYNNNLCLLIQPASFSTLKININKERESRVKELIRIQKNDQYNAKKKEVKFYDPELELIKKKKEKRRNSGFNFAEKGSYLKKAEEMRKFQTAKRFGIDLNKSQLTVSKYK